MLKFRARKLGYSGYTGPRSAEHHVETFLEFCLNLQIILAQNLFDLWSGYAISHLVTKICSRVSYKRIWKIHSAVPYLADYIPWKQMRDRTCSLVFFLLLCMYVWDSGSYEQLGYTWKLEYCHAEFVNYSYNPSVSYIADYPLKTRVTK